MLSYELSCRGCGWQTVCGSDDAYARLQLLGMLRREKEPGDELLAELLLAAAPRMTCPLCKEKKLVAQPASTDRTDDDSWDDWQAARLCEVCRRPIAPERLEALPGTKRCVDCQQSAEAGDLTDDEPEFCPKCGALVELRVSQGSGITRYKRFCTGHPPCRL